jgi:hypothetical protein
MSKNEYLERTRALRLSLRIWAAMALFIFVPLLVAFLLQAPILAEDGGALNWSIWNDVVCSGPTGACRVPPMLFVIYITWALFLLVAAEAPAHYASFLRFTMWANFAHAGLMAYQALTELDRYWSKFFTDIPFTASVAAAILLLAPALNEADAAAAVAHE